MRPRASASILQTAVTPPPKTLVEFGSGGGNNAFYLKRDFAMTLVDCLTGHARGQPRDQSRVRAPRGRHAQRAARPRLRRRLHPRRDHVHDDRRPTFAARSRPLSCTPSPVASRCSHPTSCARRSQPSTEDGGHDGEGRAIRYLEWTFDPDPGRQHVRGPFRLHAQRGRAASRVEHDVHTCGLFAREVWLRLLEQAGIPNPNFRGQLQARSLRRVETRSVTVPRVDVGGGMTISS